jgi:hypothetical protein
LLPKQSMIQRATNGPSFRRWHVCSGFISSLFSHFTSLMWSMCLFWMENLPKHVRFSRGLIIGSCQRSHNRRNWSKVLAQPHKQMILHGLVKVLQPFRHFTAEEVGRGIAVSSRRVLHWLC